MARRPTLSLCMIAKDGGASLSRCLASVRGVVDEIVVVDTGSKDDTVARAQAAGARALHHPWSDDFAAARNVGLDAATGDWILLLDCDERFEPPCPTQLREVIARPGWLGYFLPVESELAAGERLDSTILRLWRHSPRVRFRFPIHEQVLPDLEAARATTGERFALLSDLRVVHDGYTPSAIAAHGKVERNLRLFRKALALHPDEPYVAYKFADFLRGLPERKREALPIAERALAQVRRPGDVAFFGELLTIVAAGRLEAGDGAGARALLADHPPASIATPAYAYVAALACEAAGDVAAALDHAATAAAMRKSTHVTAWRPGLVAQAEALRARLHLRRGDAAAAIAACERALALRPGYLPALQLQADALAAAGRAGEALRLLTAELARAPRESRIWQQLALLLARIGQPAQAERCLAQARACAEPATASG